MTGVLIAALSPVMRAGLRALLTEAGLPVAGEVVTLEGLARAATPFDVLLVADEELLPEVGAVLDEGTVALVLLTEDEQALSLLRALPLHGWALLPPDATAEELQAAIRAAAQGLVVLPQTVATQLIQPRAAAGGEELLDPLTGREAEVLTLLGRGLSNKLIARELAISEHTVKFHVSSLFSKLGASSRTDAVSRGARHGLIVL